MSRDPSPAPSSSGDLSGDRSSSGVQSSTGDLSWEDTDAAWGDSPSGNDDRLLQDRPPHWNDY